MSELLNKNFMFWKMIPTIHGYHNFMKGWAKNPEVCRWQNLPRVYEQLKETKNNIAFKLKKNVISDFISVLNSCFVSFLFLTIIETKKQISWNFMLWGMAGSEFHPNNKLVYYLRIIVLIEFKRNISAWLINITFDFPSLGEVILSSHPRQFMLCHFNLLKSALRCCKFNSGINIWMTLLIILSRLPKQLWWP